MRGLTRGGATQRRIRIAGATLAALGVVAAFVVTRIMLERTLQRALRDVPPPDTVYRQWAQTYIDKKQMPAAFRALQMAIDAAPTPARRHANALDIVTLLLDRGDWLDARYRMRMAREYLLALADVDVAQTDPYRMAGLMLRLAITSNDRDLWQRAEALLADKPPATEVPFEIESARFDAMFLMAPSPGDIRAGLERMADCVKTQPETLAYRRRRLRAMRWALEDYPGPAAGRVIPDDLDPASDPEDVADRFATEIDRLLDCPDSTTAGEAHLHKAFLAASREDVEGERLALQGALTISPAALQTQDYRRLLALLQQTEREMQAIVLLGEMLVRPETRSTALMDLQDRLCNVDEASQVNPLFELADRYLRLTPDTERIADTVLLCAARAAIRFERPLAAERYLAAASADSDWRVRAEVSMLRADVAAQRGDTNAVMRQLIRTIALYPSHPREYDARFQWVDLVAQLPYAEADLIGGVVGALIRVPNDDRALDGLMLIAERMERYGLYALAESYYRRAVLQGSIRRDGRMTHQNAQATLGQARVLIALGRDVEANQLLRALNANDHWSRVWPESGPLWASIAVRQGQFMEAVRRWRQVCGPPNDPILALLFGVLVPGIDAIPVRTPSTARQPPSVVPTTMMRAVADAAVNQLLRDGDTRTLERVLSMIEHDPHWRMRVPIPEYRVRTLEHVIAHAPLSEVSDWFERHAGRIGEAGDGAGEGGDGRQHRLQALITMVDDVTARVRETAF